MQPELERVRGAKKHFTTSTAIMLFRLYISNDKLMPSRKDVGSVLCLTVLEWITKGVVNVVSLADAGSVPVGITGTPTLVCVSSGDIFTGHQALARLQRLACETWYEQGVEQGRKNGTTSRRATTSAAQRTTATPPATAAAKDDPQDEGALSELWESNCPEEDEDVVDEGNGKLTQEDLARAIQQRRT